MENRQVKLNLSVLTYSLQQPDNDLIMSDKKANLKFSTTNLSHFLIHFFIAFFKLCSMFFFYCK